MVSTAALVLLFALIGAAQSVNAATAAGSPQVLKPVEVQHAQDISAARAKHPVKPANSSLTPPPAQPTPAQVAGIVSTHQGPFPNSTFSVMRQYQGPAGSNWLVVFAGTTWTDYSTHTGVGALRVYDIGGRYLGTFVAAQTTYVDITEAKGSMLQLLADGHTALTFNLTTDTFGTP